MPLRAFVRANPETISDCLLAADDRYREAEELLLAQKYDGCVYLLGYAAEMWLKISCLRLRGLGAAAEVKSALAPLKSAMRQIAPAVPCPQDWRHDLSYFVECVVHFRAWSGRPLPPAVERELRTRMSMGLNEEWTVEMRYRRSALTDADAWSALLNAWWIRTNWTRLI